MTAKANPQKVTLDLMLSAEGCEAIATGRSVQSWHLTARPYLSEEDREEFATRHRFVVLDTFEIALPSEKDCIQRARDHLEARIQETRLTAYAEEREFKNRINNLLSLTHEVSND